MANIRFAQTIEPDNLALIARAAEAAEQVAAHKPTIPTTIEAEKAANPFLRADDPGRRGRGRHVGQAGRAGVRRNPRAEEQVLARMPGLVPGIHVVKPSE